MLTWRELLPAEHHNCKERALAEEGKDTLNGQRSTEDVANKPRVVTPVGTELKLKDDTRSNAYGEIYAKEHHPKLADVEPLLLACAIIDGFEQSHYYAQAQGQRHEHPMITCGKSKLRS